MSPIFDATFWDNRYAATDYVFGTAPNDFLAAVAPQLPAGPVLCVAEGEGRNAVFLARRGHAVTAVDQSAVGLAKAQALAAQHSVTLTTTVADLETYAIPRAAWSGIIVIFVHLPPALRASVLAQAVAGLTAGGLLVLECYSPAQLAYHTGGPREVTLLPTLAALRHELTGLEIVHGQEIERDVVEGGGHTGRAAVVQVIARRPS